MPHAEEILQALRALTENDDDAVFTRNDVREHLGISRERWEAGYTAIFQAMRSDHPGGAPPIAHHYTGIIERIQRGHYRLTPIGKALIASLGR